MFKCDDCPREFGREGNLKRHVEQVHSNGHADVAPEKTRKKKKAATKRAPRPKREPDGVECHVCPTSEPAIARLVTPFLSWPLCASHLQVCIAFVEPL